MSFEAIIQAHTEALNNHAAALRGEGVPAFVTNAKDKAAAAAPTGDAAAPKVDGRKKKGADAPATVESVDPLQHPAFKALVADVYKLVDLDNLNKTTRIADICGQFGVKKASQLAQAQWEAFHAAIQKGIAEASAPAPAAASSFV